MSRKLIRPTDAEEAAITAAALSDLDAQPLTDEQLSKLRRCARVDALLGSGTKVQVTMRFDEKVWLRLRVKRWLQTRMNRVFSICATGIQNLLPR